MGFVFVLHQGVRVRVWGGVRTFQKLFMISLFLQKIKNLNKNQYILFLSLLLFGFIKHDWKFLIVDIGQFIIGKIF